jgi:hypothetical protein
MNLEDYITLAHIESMNKVMLLTGSIVGIAYLQSFLHCLVFRFLYEQFAF